MKKVIVLSFILLMLVTGMVYSNPEWITDFSKAQKIAKESNKTILMDFSGSDWCRWCIKLDQEVFSKKEFQVYADKNLVLFMADFPRKKEVSPELKKQNEQLAKKYQVRGLPTVILLNSKGEQIGKTGYQPGGPEAYIKHLKEFIK